ncbi:uncharacterized protein C21orf140 homolog [Silurus meridionalis]|uniref:uncharacterized protein C21orf140 homolog n=1 Tax=Silurus meridionalis TaxID=175797 RepID=UPI001EEA3738|nr:uncharacterized protein C21orf140 homolog [Silurus meridionalis]
MRLKLMNVVRQMCQRNMCSQSGHTAYISEVHKLQSKGFYPVYVGKAEINEGLLTGNMSYTINPQSATQKYQSILSIIHAGGARGWVPWKYKLHAHLSNFTVRPDKTIFPELCAKLKDHYGNCAVIVNPEDSEEFKFDDSGNSLYPSSSVEFLPMICCPKVAESYGHKMLKTPPDYYAHLNPLNIAWSRVKWHMHNNRKKYTGELYYEGILHKVMDFEEIVKAALSMMTQDEWKDTVTRELWTAR